MWYSPRTIDMQVSENPSNTNYQSNKPQNKDGIGRTAKLIGLSAILAATSFLYGCSHANNKKGRIQEPIGIESLDITKEEKEFLKQYDAEGRPYLFENPTSKEWERWCLKQGWDIKHLSDSQIIQLKREIDDFVGGLKSMK